MKRVYVLICSNEEHFILSVEAFATEKEASEKMKLEYERERECQEQEFSDVDGHVSDDGAAAYVTYGESYGYYWEVKPVNIPDTVSK